MPPEETNHDSIDTPIIPMFCELFSRLDQSDEIDLPGGPGPADGSGSAGGSGSSSWSGKPWTLYTYCQNLWGRHHLTYRVSGAPQGLDEQAVKNAITLAFQWWKVATRTMTFSPELDPDKVVDIEIGFFRGEKHHPYDEHTFPRLRPGYQKLLGHAFAPIPIPQHLHGDIHFSTHVPWSIQKNGVLGQPKTFDLVTAAAHEIGHALGLDHVDVPDQLMSATINRVFAGVDSSSVQALHDLHAGNKKVTVEYLQPGPSGGGSNPWRLYGKIPLP